MCNGAPGESVAPRAFVDVVAQVNDEIDIFPGEVLIGGEVAGFVVLARGEGEAEAFGQHVGGRRGARAALGADFATDSELIPIPPIGPQNLDFNVDGVGPLGRGGGGAGFDDTRHGFVVAELPCDFDGFGRNAATHFERLGREAGPKDDAIGEAIPRANG